MYDFDSLRGELNLKDIGVTERFKREFRKAHPEYFDPDGLLLFCGGQGSGKTLSAVRYLHRLSKKYPDVKIISNIKLDIGATVFPWVDLDDVDNYDNGYAGIVLFLDEIQVLFASMESNKIPPSRLQIISQQRKRRLHIVGTTQLFKRVAKQFREQCNAICDCDGLIGGRIQRNAVIDLGTIAEDSSGNLTTYEYAYKVFWYRAKRYFDMYDTSEKVYRDGGKKH